MVATSQTHAQYQGFPKRDTPAVDLETGQWSIPWYQFLVSLWRLLGGSNNSNADAAFLQNNGGNVSLFNSDTGAQIGTGAIQMQGDPVAITGAPLGAVVFIGAGHVLSFDAAQFFWNAASGKLGIGGVPGGTNKLQIVGSGITLDNTQAYALKTSADVEQSVLSLDGSDVLALGNPAGSLTVSSGAGNVTLSPNSDVVGIGGETAAFPAIKRNAAALNIRVADDSADADLAARGITASADIGGVNIRASSIINTGGFTVGGTLPAPGIAGRRAYVTNALAPAFLAPIAGGGAVVCPVFDNGVAWVAG